MLMTKAPSHLSPDTTAAPFHLTADALNAPNLSHGFFGRRGGVSAGLLDSLNVGYGTKDSVANVNENRARISAALGAHGLASLYQVHSAKVEVVTAPFAHDARPEADALVTATRGLALGILTADCVPVLFADPVNGVIGAAHAGWQGALGGVTHRTLEAMIALGAKLREIRVAIGPSIQQQSYEVGDDLRQKFLAQYKTNDRFFAPKMNGKYWFDLPDYVHAQLTAAGVRYIENLGTDTYSDESSWFSFRRTTHRKEPDYGRQLSAICLK